MNRPRLHVLVINWNGLEHLEECFASLLASDYPNAEFVLVDNASEDGSVAFVRERYGRDPRVRIVECPANLGWSGGNNAGLRRALDAGADYALLLNNDTWTAPDALSQLVAFAESHPRAGAVAPKMLLHSAPALLNSLGIVCSLIGSSGDIGLGRLDGPRWDAPQQVLGACGGACLLRLEALERTGLLPEDFGIYLDDLDLCLRIWAAGYEVWRCPAAVFRHKFGATMEQGRRSRRKYFLNTRNRFYLLLRNFPAAGIGAVLPRVALGEVKALGRAVLDGEGWRVPAHLRAWGAALRYVPAALRERRRRRRAGLDPRRFWPLIARDWLFFPGAELPVRGLYAQRDWQGRRVRPMSREAELDLAGEGLRVSVVNCYPRLGPAAVEIRRDDGPAVLLEASGRHAASFPFSRGRLRCTAMQVFEAEATGALMDIGAWLIVEPLEGAEETAGNGPARPEHDAE